MAGYDEDLLWSAVSEMCTPIMKLEKEWEQNKLEKKIRDYFRKSAKGLEFGIKPWDVLVNDYADSVFGTLFNTLGDREWLGQADFLLVLDAGIKDNFPPHALAQVPQQAFERAVLAAHDRAFEEQRFLPLLWEVVQSMVQGDKSRKKIYNNFEEGRKQAAAACSSESWGSANPVEEFTGCWIDASIAALSKVCNGEPEYTLPASTAVQMFHSLLEAGALPLGLVQENGQPPMGWPFVDQAVQQAYAMYTFDESQGSDGGLAMSKGKGKACCWGKADGGWGKADGGWGKAGGKADGCWGKAGGKAGGKADFGWGKAMPLETFSNKGKGCPYGKGKDAKGLFGAGKGMAKGPPGLEDMGMDDLGAGFGEGEGFAEFGEDPAAWEDPMAEVHGGGKGYKKGGKGPKGGCW